MCKLIILFFETDIETEAEAEAVQEWQVQVLEKKRKEKKNKNSPPHFAHPPKFFFSLSSPSWLKCSAHCPRAWWRKRTRKKTKKKGKFFFSLCLPLFPLFPFCFFPFGFPFGNVYCSITTSTIAIHTVHARPSEDIPSQILCRCLPI